MHAGTLLLWHANACACTLVCDLHEFLFTPPLSSHIHCLHTSFAKSSFPSAPSMSFARTMTTSSIISWLNRGGAVKGQYLPDEALEEAQVGRSEAALWCTVR